MEGIISKLIEEREIYNDIIQKIDILEKTQKNIQTLFELLIKEKDKTFIYLQRFSIYELFNSILTFTNNNKDFFEKNNEIEIKIFFEFLRYFTERQFVWSLEWFEKVIKVKYKDNKEILAFIWTEIFYKNFIKVINNKINDLLWELVVTAYEINGIQKIIFDSRNRLLDDDL